MNEQEVLILTEQKGGWQNKTRDITQIDIMDDKYEITFKQGKAYTYNKSKVRYFNKPDEVNLQRSIVRIKNQPDKDWDLALIFGPYICLFRGNYSHFEPLKNIDFIPNVATDKPAKQLIEYYKSIATALTGPTQHLNRYYEKLRIIRRDSVLKTFISRNAPNRYSRKNSLIFPFGVNPSQRRAVIKALESQVSLIQGPPGTGKTQTILNIVANLVVQGKSVAVVAGNNSATDNVFEKLEKEGISFIVSKLGRWEQQEKFFANEHDLPDISDWALDHLEHLKLIKQLDEADKLLTGLLEAKNQLATLKENLNRLNVEKQYFGRHFDVEAVNPERWSFANKWSTPNLLKFLAELEYYSQYDRLNWPIKLRWLYRYRIFRFKDLRKISDLTVKGVISEYYRRRSQELEDEQNVLKQRLDIQRFEDVMAQYTQVSLLLFRHHVAKHYHKVDNVNFNERSYKSKFQTFLKRFPVVLSTSDSIISNKGEADVFDYLIVDEASQVDLLTGFLAMSCAKNIVAVGDLKQLPHIPNLENLKEQTDKKFDIQPGYSYWEDCLLSSLATVFQGSVPTTLLKEHYRCHPRIIDFCNQKFYNGELVIITDSTPDPFKVLKTAPGSYARRPPSNKSLINERELDVIVNEVLSEELQKTSCDDIGIATPYRGQADEAKTHIGMDGLQIDTVYKFQGREKGTIIFSTTANSLNDFVDDPHLLNVAVSRAKQRFIMVTSRNSFRQQGSNIGDLIRHIEYQSLSESIFESKTVSIFDCLYQEYSDVLKAFLEKVKNRSEYPSENLMEALLEEVLGIESYRSFAYKTNYPLTLLVNDFSLLNEREQRFASHPNSHVDFLLYNKLDKQPVLAIEVDGYRFHRLNEKQQERDRVKDSILEKLEISLLRFSTTGSGEQEKLEEALGELLENIPESEEEQLQSAN